MSRKEFEPGGGNHAGSNERHGGNRGNSSANGNPHEHSSRSGAGLRDRAAMFRRDAPQPATPPEDASLRLATFPRQEGEELRVSWSEYKGAHFLSFRVWKQGSGGMWPQKGQGCTIKVRELGDLAIAIADAMDLAEGGSHE